MFTHQNTASRWIQSFRAIATRSISKKPPNRKNRKVSRLPLQSYYRIRCVTKIKIPLVSRWGSKKRIGWKMVNGCLADSESGNAKRWGELRWFRNERWTTKNSGHSDRESRRWQGEKQREQKRCASCSLYKYIYLVCGALVVGGLYSWNATHLVFRSVFSRGTRGKIWSRRTSLESFEATVSYHTRVCECVCVCVCVCIRSVSVSQLLTQFQISRPSRARNISPLWESAPRLVPRMLPFRRLRTIVRSYLPTMEAIDRLDCHRMHAKHARILLFRGISITFLRGLSTNVFIYKDIDR